ncbi:MAG: hypothetical protein KDA24_10005 [Deltaproteobacteria bacterium]|nr:hypothetical protein [Deltaproteobacteria bacterium]
MLTVLTGALLGVVALVLPGWLAARALDDGDLLWRVAVGVGVGVLVVPFAAFLLAWLLGVSMKPLLLVATSALVSGPLLWRERVEGGRS